MDDPLFVRRFECLGDLFRDRQRLVAGDRSTEKPIRKILPLDQFHRERADVPGLFEAVNVRDVRVVQRGQRLRFARETRHAPRIIRERIGEDLERHVTIELRIVRAIYLPHAAGTEYTNDFVHAETGAGCEGQRLPRIIQAIRQREREPGYAVELTAFRAEWTSARLTRTSAI